MNIIVQPSHYRHSTFIIALRPKGSYARTALGSRTPTKLESDEFDVIFCVTTVGGTIFAIVLVIYFIVWILNVLGTILAIMLLFHISICCKKLGEEDKRVDGTKMDDAVPGIGYTKY